MKTTPIDTLQHIFASSSSIVIFVVAESSCFEMALLLLYQIWQSRRELQRSKEAVVLKLPPRPSKCRIWWENFKISFYKCYCYCDPNDYPEDWYDQLWCNGTEPNEYMKLVLGYVGAVFMAILLCIFFVFKYPWSPIVVGLTCGFVVMVLSYAMFFRLPRCWFLLMLPEFLSVRSRAIVILLALSWTMVGPATNAQTNFRFTAEMLSCVQEQVNQEGSNLKSIVKNNLKSRAAKFIKAKEDIERALKKIRDALKSVYNAFVRMGRAIRRAFGWLDSRTKLCDKEAAAPYENCAYWFEIGRINCREKLSHPSVSWLCKIWNGLLLVLDVIGCYWLKLIQILCQIPDRIAKFIKEQVLERIKAALDAAIKRIEKAFAFDVEIKRNISYVEKFESNMSYFREEAKRHIENLKWWFRFFSNVFDALIWITFALMLLNAIRYQKKYLSSPRFDNYFITEELHEADRQRIRYGKETALPLTVSERSKYIHATSIWLATNEKWRMIRPILSTTACLLFILFWIAIDHVLWQMMTEQYLVLMEEGGVDVPNYYKIHVQGLGLLSNAYRSLLEAFTPQNFDQEDLTKKWQICIVEPSVPDFELNKTLYIMMASAYFTIIFQNYLQRTRHAVCFLFWPEQEKKRAAELQNKILVLRGSWMYFARKQLANRKSSKLGLGQVAMQRVAASIPVLGKLIRLVGDETKICFECNDQIKLEDLENYRSCDLCNTPFCSDCFYRCPNCQSCGGDKMPRALFIDYEQPAAPKSTSKTPEKRKIELQLMNIYGSDGYLAKRPSLKTAKSVKSGKPFTEIPPEETLPGPSSDHRYNLPPRSPRGRGRQLRRIPKRSPLPKRLSRSRSPSVKTKRSPRKLSRPVSKSRKRSTSSSKSPQRRPIRSRKLSGGKRPRVSKKGGKL